LQGSLDLLEKTQLPPNQARAILQAMELEITAHEVRFCSRAELQDSVHSLKDALHSLETRIDSRCSDLSLKIEALRGELKTDIKSVESKLNAVEGKLMRWTLTCVFSQTAVMAGAVYFALTHMRP
jgi:chromosome segregation ATPase